MHPLFWWESLSGMSSGRMEKGIRIIFNCTLIAVIKVMQSYIDLSTIKPNGRLLPF
jgi:hypothetical protein